MMIQQVLGKVTYSKDAIIKIISQTITATQGIAAMSEGLVEGLARKLTTTRSLGGIELTLQDAGLHIRLSVIIQYGMKMHEVCHELQHNVREAVERTAGLAIDGIDIRVEGVAV